MKRSTLLALFTLLAASTAHAQNKKDFSTVRLYPSVGPGNYIGVDGASVGKHLSSSYGAFFDFSSNTLSVEDPCDGVKNAASTCVNKDTNFVHSTALLHLTTSVSLYQRTQLSLDVPLGGTDSEPFNAQTTTTTGNPTVVIQPAQGFQFADSRLAAKTRIWEDRNNELRFAATAFTTLPTAMITSHGDCREPEQCSYLGERGVQAGAYGVGEFARGDFSGALNLGVQYRPNRKFLTVETGTELLYGLAGAYQITPLLAGKAEVVGWASFIGKDYPLEARAQIAYGEDFQVRLGAGAGIVGNVGSPTYRVFAGLQWTPSFRDADRDGLDDRKDACPSDAEDRDGFMDSDGCPDPDNDGDGVPDAADGCDNEREDKDGFADDDGCPELDNDGDGVPDGYDSCEGQKEDLDGDRDDDGCPDLDADRDSIPDAKDLCPNEPEDSDGLGDEDGCPEKDFDGDTVPDEQDACPDAPESWNDLLDEDGCPEDDEDADSVPDQLDQCPDHAETLNGKTDADGCPDGARLMVLQGQRLLPTATAHFEGNTLRGASFLVETVADYVKRNHKRGGVRVVVVAPAGDKHAADRAKELADALHKRAGREISSGVVAGEPVRVEIELLPPGLSELPRPKPTGAAVPASSAPASVQQPAPAVGTPAAPAAGSPAAPPASAPSAPAPTPNK